MVALWVVLSMVHGVVWAFRLATYIDGLIAIGLGAPAWLANLVSLAMAFGPTLAALVVGMAAGAFLGRMCAPPRRWLLVWLLAISMGLVACAPPTSHILRGVAAWVIPGQGPVLEQLVSSFIGCGNVMLIGALAGVGSIWSRRGRGRADGAFGRGKREGHRPAPPVAP